jgi:uncharacterized protein YciU (UPF0263 family)
VVVGGFWLRLLDTGFKNTPKEFIAEGDKVVAICDVELAGDHVESADLLTFDEHGKLMRFETIGGYELMDRAFPR